MSNYNSLKTTIDANIKQNGNQEITGQILNSVLNAMVTTLGAGYQFAGVATTATNPGSPDAKVFYIANGKGTYTNFSGLEVTEDEVVVLYWDSSWHKVSTGIASQAKLTELEKELKGNIVFSLIENKYIKVDGTVSDYTGWAMSDYIPCLGIKSVIITNDGVLSKYNHFYDADKKPIGTNFQVEGETIVDVIDGASFFVLSNTIASMKNTTISVGSSMAEQIDNNKKGIALLARKLVSYNDIEKVNGYYIGKNGSVNAHEGYIYFSIPCKYGMKLSFPQFYSGNVGCCFYAPNGNTIEPHLLEGQQGSEITLTTPSDAYVLKVSCYFMDESSFYVRENIGSLVTSPMNGSIDKLKTNFIIHDDDTDFIPEWIPNTFINQNGVQTNATGLYSTGKVYLQEDVNYYWGSLINGYYAFYREDGSLIEGHPNNDGSLTNPFRVPIGTSYGRFTAPNEGRSKMAFISVRNFKPSPMTYKLSDSIMTDGGTFCNYKGNEICMFNKGLAIGDSLTEGVFNHNEGGTMQYLVDTKYSYPAILKKISGVDIVNKGVGGYTSDDWYNRFKNEDLSGFDFAIIQLGVNDLSRYGSWTSTTETAYTNIINKLKAENKNIKIFVATLIPAKNYFSVNSIAFSDSIRAFVASLNDANVILEDIAIYGHGKDSDAYNAGHLSALGYCRLAEDHKNLISYLISLDRNNYRYVQFIGTDYSYSE